jgi:hypothetical protein
MISETPEEQVQGKFSTELALISFAIGTVLLIIQKLTPLNIEILIIGLLYTLFAILANVIMLFKLLSYFIKLPKQREYLAIKILILLANIPITYLYFQIVFNK